MQSLDYGPRSSGVERLLGKEEVMSSNLIAGSSKDCLDPFQNDRTFRGQRQR